MRDDEGPETVLVRTEGDLAVIRQAVRAAADASGLGATDRVRLLTAASELGRNLLLHGGGGEMTVEIAGRGGDREIVLRFLDRGPGIEDPGLALTDGYTTSRGLGLGLGGSARLLDGLDVRAREGGGTEVVARKTCRGHWERP